jgi:acyl-CoA synthetase (AMP-forming)/AMP-acid ligase II
MGRIGNIVSRTSSVLSGTAATLAVVRRCGVLRPYPPSRLARLPAVAWREGIGVGGLYDLHSALDPTGPAALGEAGDRPITNRQMAERVQVMATELAGQRVGPGVVVGLLGRNSEQFLVAIVALAKLGADALYLNTGFAPPQLAEVVRREGAGLVLVDTALADRVADFTPAIPCVLLDGAPVAEPDAEAPTAHFPASSRRRGRSESGQIVLTSGTTGSPKGARRSLGVEVAPVISLLSRIPLRATDRIVVAAPMFHSWGLVNTLVGATLGACLLPEAHFEPEAILAQVERQRATAVIAVPVMIQRIMALAPEVRARYDTSSLRVVAVSGSALPGELALRFMDAFGEVLFNLYGSTEVGWAAVADPQDLRAAPGTAGHVPLGTSVRILDDDGRPLRRGETGRIFVQGRLRFEGYTGGGGKEIRDGHVSSGDIGHLDAAGRLFVDGREDDMIVSGGENVFPREVEDLLADHPGVVEAAVIGVPDETFGQSLTAYVVRSPSSSDGAELGVDDIQDYVHARLARFKVPRRVLFVDVLPRNATGKVVKRLLAT